LPTITVRNPGSEPSGYRMEAAPVLGTRGRPLHPSWFRFEPSRFALTPGGTQAVRVRLEVARGAHAGHYEGLLKAELASVGSGNVVGGAAAARVSFHVRSTRSLGDRIWHFVTDHAVLFAAIAAVALAAALGFFLRRRFTFRIQRRPGR